MSKINLLWNVNIFIILKESNTVSAHNKVLLFRYEQ